MLRLGVDVHLDVEVLCLGVAETSREGSRVHLGVSPRQSSTPWHALLRLGVNSYA